MRRSQSLYTINYMHSCKLHVRHYGSPLAHRFDKQGFTITYAGLTNDHQVEGSRLRRVGCCSRAVGRHERHHPTSRDLFTNPSQSNVK